MDRDYFRTIEEAFVELRGAPLLLSPDDWQIARTWWERGVPAQFVVEELERIFRRRDETGATQRVHRLKYVARAIDEAWKEREELLATGARESGQALVDVPTAIASLADRLPEDLGALDRWRRRLGELAASGEEPGEIEKRLEEIEREILETVRRNLDPSARREIRDAVDAALQPVRERLTPRKPNGCGADACVRHCASTPDSPGSVSSTAESPGPGEQGSRRVVASLPAWSSRVAHPAWGRGKLLASASGSRCSSVFSAPVR